MGSEPSKAKNTEPKAPPRASAAAKVSNSIPEEEKGNEERGEAVIMREVGLLIGEVIWIEEDAQREEVMQIGEEEGGLQGEVTQMGQANHHLEEKEDGTRPEEVIKVMEKHHSKKSNHTREVTHSEEVPKKGVEVDTVGGLSQEEAEAVDMFHLKEIQKRVKMTILVVSQLSYKMMTIQRSLGS